MQAVLRTQAVRHLPCRPEAVRDFLPVGLGAWNTQVALLHFGDNGGAGLATDFADCRLTEEETVSDGPKALAGRQESQADD